ETKFWPVEGQVMLTNGKPVHNGTVILTPDAGKGNTSLEIPHGEIDANGHFKIMTREKSGASAGWYLVAITAAEKIDPNNPYFTKWLIDKKYTDNKTSNLALEVVENP